MRDPFFEGPIVIETETPGAYRTLVSVSEAAIFMMDSWPGDHGERYRGALQACTGHLTTPQQVQAAREAFVAAAEEAGLVVVEQSANAARRPRGDAKRKNRARMEEEEEFLVRFLARETGITETQARGLINMVGTDRSSLLREARILKGQH